MSSGSISFKGGLGMSDSKDGLNQTKRLMGALVRMKPKPHEEMKVGKTKREVGKPTSRPSSRKKSDENRKPK